MIFRQNEMSVYAIWSVGLFYRVQTFQDSQNQPSQHSPAMAQDQVINVQDARSRNHCAHSKQAETNPVNSRTAAGLQGFDGSVETEPQGHKSGYISGDIAQPVMIDVVCRRISAMFLNGVILVFPSFPKRIQG